MITIFLSNYMLKLFYVFIIFTKWRGCLFVCLFVCLCFLYFAWTNLFGVSRTLSKTKLFYLMQKWFKYVIVHHCILWRLNAHAFHNYVSIVCWCFLNILWINRETDWFVFWYAVFFYLLLLFFNFQIWHGKLNFIWL